MRIYMSDLLSIVDFDIFIRFCFVGILGVAINFSLTYLQKEILKWNKYFSNTSGFCISISINFILNRNWTFRAIDGALDSQMIKYFMVALIGVLLNHLVVYFGVQKFRINFYLSKVFAVGIVFIWNFLLHSFFTFV